MIDGNNVNGRKNTVAAKAERAIAEGVIRELLDIRNDKNQLFKYKVYAVFNKNLLATLKQDLTSFILSIEELVCVRTVSYKPIPL